MGEIKSSLISPCTLSTLILCCFSTMSNAEDKAPLTSPISTARPSFSSAATTLDKGYWQLEGGYQFTSNDDGGVETESHSVPNVFLRAGLTERVELNLFWSGYNNVDDGVNDFDGVSDLGIGVSYQLPLGDSKLDASIFGAVNLPTGSDDFTSDTVDPNLGLAWAYTLDSGPSVFGTFVASSSSSNDERETGLGTAIGMSQSFSEQTGAYIEYFSVHSDSADSTHSIGGGIVYLLSNDVQLDVNGGIGLNDVADDFFLGFGMAIRY